MKKRKWTHKKPMISNAAARGSQPSRPSCYSSAWNPNLAVSANVEKRFVLVWAQVQPLPLLLLLHELTFLELLPLLI